MQSEKFERFNSKSAEYEKGRPSYPLTALEHVCKEAGLSFEMAVADIGAGTGLLTKTLRRCFNDVTAIEPNDEMRSLIKGSSFKGTAEATGLSDQSVNAIFAAQAFHWFHPDKTRREFQRILKGPRCVVLIWNDRAKASHALGDLEILMSRLQGKSDQKLHGDDKAIRSFFSENPVQYAEFPNPTSLNREAFCAMVLSRSYAPAKGSTEYESLVTELNALFDEHAVHSLFSIEYTTRVYWGRL
jgi:hypothetical protein